ncbi:MAG: hypothetical protein OQK04_00255 [Kangiellaceae bacterium]|nr:hypothetical protein [Kangiellaceae bacterium]MCW8997131.1 hypothetical protein [Kangiellaceae bacterium]
MFKSNISRLASALLIVPLVYIGSSQYYSQHCGFIFDSNKHQLINSLDEDLIHKLRTNRSVSLSDACQMTSSKLQRAIDKAIGPKPDHPGEAAKFRYEQQLSENNKFNVENWHKARNQVKNQLKFERKDAGINSTVWEELGPGNIGGRVRSLAFDPNDATRIYAGSVSGGIWLTENAGTSWAPIDDFMANLSISSIIFDPTNSNIMYAGTGEGTFNADNVRGLGIFKSTDKGATWNILTATKDSFDFYWVNRLTILNDASRLIAATHTGIWHSEDGGTSWNSTLSARVFDVNVDPTDNAKLVAGGQGDAYYSTDGGLNWTAASGLGSISGRIEIAYAPSDPTIVYVSANVNSGEIWKSTDSGQSYSLVNTGNSYLGSQGWYDNVIWVDPVDPDHVIVGGIDLWRTTDGGTSLNKISTWWKAPTSAHADHHFIQEHPDYDGVNNKQVYFGNDGGVYTAPDITVANDDVGWTELNNNLSITQFYGMGVGPNGRIVAGTQDNGTLVYNGDSENWTTTFGGDGGFSAADPNDENYLYGEYVYLNIHRSTNGGISSSYIYDSAMEVGANFIAPFILDPNNENRLLGGAAELWVTENAKASNPTWTSKKPAISGNESISAIAVEPGNSDVIYIGHDDGSVYKTSDGTAATPNWTDISGTLPSRRVLRLTVAPLNNQVIYATFSGYNSDNLWKSTDGGATWNVSVGTSPTNIPPAPIRSVIVHPTENNLLYVGTEVGIFTSEDAGATWSLENDGPANVSVDELVWHGASTLYAATHGRGIFKATVNDVTPDGLVFNDILDAPLSTEQTSPQQTITGVGTPVQFSISDGEYSIGCNGTFIDTTSTVDNGDTFCVRHTSSANYYTVTTTSFSIGAGNYTFVSRTVADTLPDNFSFDALTDVNLSESQTSNEITVSGITNQVDVSVTNGEYSIGCTSTFTDQAGTIALGETVCVRHTSSDQHLGVVTTTLNIGDGNADFTSTTLPDTTPDNFSFTDVTDVAISTAQTSNTITVAGIQVDVPISVTGGEYSVGCMSNSFTSTAGMVSSGDTVCVRHTSSSNYVTQTTTTLDIGSVTADFSSTTSPDRTPDSFSFSSVSSATRSTQVTSDTVTISGIAVDVNISVSNGEYSIGCNGTFTSSAATIGDGESVCVRHTTSSSYSSTIQTTLTVGTESAMFNSTTESDPNPTSSSSGSGSFGYLFLVLVGLVGSRIRNR